ncbi:ATP-grasp domain-containing protein [Halobaculum litoreum]|uniref:carboxylate--amine ligase n=1 Tax=Halobaculum litoreum TaxID=3031998 RepID=UPI0024C275D8|nr:ATP-grasp domain-containing protein [Halobaculum sp. DT92]
MTLDDGSALVLDAGGQAGLSLVRSLGRKGVAVTAGSTERFSLGRLSRHSTGGYRYPEPEADGRRFLDHLVEYLETHDRSVVFPTRDSTSALCARHKPELEATGTTVAVEDWDTFERAYDKGALFELAATLPVDTPTTVAPTSPAAVADLADEVPYPAVVKPRSKTLWDDDGRCHVTLVDDAHYVASPEELVPAYEALLARNPALEREAHYPLVQEYVPGTTTTTVVLADAGEVLLHFQEERVRTYPDSGGSSTLLRPLRDDDMLAAAETVIGALEWTGPAMVEFMRRPDGSHALIEVNGRYWGSVPFAIQSGVDVPWQHYRLLRGLDVDATDYTRPVPLFHRLLYGDLKWLAEQVRAGNPAAVATVAWTCLVAKQAFVSTEDPVPTLAAVAEGQDGARAAARVGRRVAGDTSASVSTRLFGESIGARTR